MMVFGNRKQSGTSTVEFAIVGALFFLVLLAVIELSRGLFVWNGLTEVTRRAARIAAVCPINHDAIARIAVFDGPAGTGQSPIISGLSADDITIEYLDGKGILLPDPVGNFSQIRFVRGSITGYEHSFLIPFIEGPLTFAAPGFATTIPRESLGIPREGESATCFGLAN